MFSFPITVTTYSNLLLASVLVIQWLKALPSYITTEKKHECTYDDIIYWEYFYWEKAWVHIRWHNLLRNSMSHTPWHYKVQLITKTVTWVLNYNYIQNLICFLANLQKDLFVKHIEILYYSYVNRWGNKTIRLHVTLFVCMLFVNPINLKSFELFMNQTRVSLT
jgi:hypothetical protein